MANARHGNWHRAGPAAVSASALLVALAAPGCGGPGEGTTGTGGTATTTTTHTAGTGGTTGGTGGTTGGTGGSTGGTAPCGPIGVTDTPTIESAADAHGAMDSTPDSCGTAIYFTAIKNGDPGVFKAAGGTVTDLAVGDPLAAPFGISISGDDTTLFVADAGFDVTPGDPDTLSGAILQLDAGGGVPKVVDGTQGYRPRGLDVYPDLDGDLIYFTGIEPMTLEPGVFTRLAAGGGITSSVTGGLFVAPSGVAAGKDKVFVTDSIGSDTKVARILKIENNTATTFVDNIGVGYPAGISLSSDEKTLIVSGFDLDTQTDRILFVDVATKQVTAYKDGGVSDNTDAGGLHRARKADVFSWADLTAGPQGGSVYKVTFK